MSKAHLSQAALAKRVGVSQQTIGRLASGDVHATKYLHKIARELGTTPAYLSGETDDPDADAPATPELTHEHRELIELFDGMAPKDRAALMQLARTIATSARSPTIHAGGRQE